MLSSKDIYAFYQTYFCLLSNVNMITTKYLRLIIRGCRCIKYYLNIKIECLLNKYSVFPFRINKFLIFA